MMGVLTIRLVIGPVVFVTVQDYGAYPLRQWVAEP
jgi:hypothetical protein